MSFAMLRNAARSASRRATRQFSATAENPALTKYLAEEKALTQHATQTTDLWRKISYYGCFPGIVAVVAWVYNVEVEHAAHIEHLKEENGGELPETPAYDFLNRRAKPFPWGANSLFWNPDANKNMEE
ncbi:hypothetical protein CC1G_10278 [Coprinopsis cinerea okayama7|uniref:Uncharacterized protein n=1 Tax=Coprinopsis cinerea (strain Okayama-7 / 130 / ATCC MYA-4618 / FGSC 9003) TaxID=240176 RepID=A8N157_COPC7|nr:hypothetical protein CC1G_10278 [Coprinopsis cinerea okayama7\|eukprot:XP_001828607.1 hypothetical protein CC1G_10278 [Coprinopsis cinerea okayama7\